MTILLPLNIGARDYENDLPVLGVGDVVSGSEYGPKHGRFHAFLGVVKHIFSWICYDTCNKRIKARERDIYMEIDRHIDR